MLAPAYLGLTFGFPDPDINGPLTIQEEGPRTITGPAHLGLAQNTAGNNGLEHFASAPEGETIVGNENILFEEGLAGHGIIVGGISFDEPQRSSSGVGREGDLLWEDWIIE